MGGRNSDEEEGGGLPSEEEGGKKKETRHISTKLSNRARHVEGLARCSPRLFLNPLRPA